MPARNDTLLTIARWILAGGCLLLCAFSWLLYQRTLVVWWRPLAAAVAAALLTAPLLSGAWHRITGSRSRLPNVLCHLAVTGSCTLFALLGGNLYLADPGSDYEEEVLVESRSHLTRQRYRTLRHHRRTPAGRQEINRLDLRFADGTLKRRQVSGTRYSRTPEGTRLRLTLRRGLFGFPVIREGI